MKTIYMYKHFLVKRELKYQTLYLKFQKTWLPVRMKLGSKCFQAIIQFHIKYHYEDFILFNIFNLINDSNILKTLAATYVIHQNYSDDNWSRSAWWNQLPLKTYKLFYHFYVFFFMHIYWVYIYREMDL